MQSVKQTFQTRADEIETYFVFLENFVTDSTDDDLNKILKSNLLLMLYNLVESSISNALEEIHNDIHSNVISFDVLKIELREVLIKHLKKHLNPKDFVQSITSIALDIVKKSFDKERISAGNIDSRKISELGKNYGFSSNTNYTLTKSGQCLVVIKGRRNDLAHGTYSFTEVGKDYTVVDLKAMKIETINYISAILANIESYLFNKEYLHPAVV